VRRQQAEESIEAEPGVDFQKPNILSIGKMDNVFKSLGDYHLDNKGLGLDFQKLKGFVLGQMYFWFLKLTGIVPRK
jgi:hypothetical protein